MVKVTKFELKEIVKEMGIKYNIKPDKCEIIVQSKSKGNITAEIFRTKDGIYYWENFIK